MILSIETATELCGVALVHNRSCIAQRSVVEKNVHSERLMVLVDEVLREADVDLGALDGIAVSIGPGSFTGLRIGLSVATGLAYARSLPLAAVPTLDAVAYEALRLSCHDAATGDVVRGATDPIGGISRGPIADAPPAAVFHTAGPEVVCAAIDAKRDEAYYAFYELQPCARDGASEPSADGLHCTSPHAIAPVSDIAAQFPPGILVRVAGDGAAKIAAVLQDMPADAARAVLHCSPVAVGLLAESRFAALIVADYSELEPVYIRDFVTTMPRIATQMAIT